MPDKKLCSVIVPCYRCTKYLEQTMDSAFAQTYQALEFILIDDASGDGTWDLLCRIAARDPRVRLFRNPENLGVAETRNRGFSLARGDYIALLDSDDLWEPDKLEKQISLLEETRSDFCYSSCSFLDGEGRPTGKIYSVPAACSLSAILRENFICCSSVVLRREITLSHSMNSGYFHEDLVFWIDLLRDGAAACGCPEPLLKYRIFAGGRSGNKLSAARNRWIIYRRHLGMSVFSSARYFVSYCWRGLRKQLRAR